MIHRAAGPQPNSSYRSVSIGPLPLVAAFLSKQQALSNLLYRGRGDECRVLELIIVPRRQAAW